MKVQDLVKMQVELADTVCLGYLQDLSDQEWMQHPHAQCNYLNWQVGHLIASENEMMKTIAADVMPDLPPGFREKYTKETAGSNDAVNFVSKDELLKIQKDQRAGTLAVLEKVQDSDFDKPTGVKYAPTVAAMLNLQGSHWLMHAGQWVVVRRQCGKPPLF